MTIEQIQELLEQNLSHKYDLIKYSPYLQDGGNYSIMILSDKTKLARRVVDRGGSKKLSWCIYDYKKDDRL